MIDRSRAGISVESYGTKGDVLVILQVSDPPVLGRGTWWKYGDGQCQGTTMSKLPVSHGGAKATDEERRIENASAG